ncbi:type II secretion system protein [Sulfuricurvum sp.]|jgi:prepilin-type N-terminal cleavage/methylation domain-containing protein|uniref:type II secretion system protein n=1 Tax=Sulfuricurvum sp. TaxID=2025608 RepID=UPI0035647A64
MRHAFSLLELIFVIVLIGIISGIGFYMSRPDYARQDAQYTLLKLKEARYRAIGYQSPNGFGVDGGCVTLTAIALSNSDESPRHEIKATISPINTLTPEQNICFDALGRPHDGNSTSLLTLLPTDLNITFVYGDKNSTVRLYCGTGYAIIPCK